MKRMLLTTLCYMEKGNQYLMLHRVKKEHDINKDKWIGVGGKFEDKESPEDCLLREVCEETGLTLTSWKFRGIITFVTDRYETEFMHLYTADGWEGEMIECNEGNLEWLEKKEVFKVWEGDKIFFWLMQHDAPFFSLRLEYVGDELVSYALNGVYHRQNYVGQNMYQEFLETYKNI
jgi:8-oxo-dGTP diphosphatase